MVSGEKIVFFYIFCNKSKIYKNNDVHSYFLFWDIVKILQTCYFEKFETAWSCPVIMIISTLQETLIPKVLKFTFRKLWSLSTCKKSISSLTAFLSLVKTSQTCYFGNFGNAWPSPIKIILSICSKLSCLSACKKSTITQFFLKILQRNSKLVILGNLGMPGHTHLKW